MTELNDNHKRALLNTFRHVDNIFSEIERKIEFTGRSSLFQDYEDDLTPVQRILIKEYIAEIRSAMSRILESKNISICAAPTSMRRIAAVAISFADIAVEEIRSKFLRGYGELSAVAVRELDEIASELQKILKQMSAGLTGESAEAELNQRSEEI